MLPPLGQKAIRAAREKVERDTDEVQALIQHEVDLLQVSMPPEATNMANSSHFVVPTISI